MCHTSSYLPTPLSSLLLFVWLFHFCFPSSLFLLVFLLLCHTFCCQAGFSASKASEEKEEEQLQCEGNTDSHQRDPQEERCVVFQTAGVDRLFSSLLWHIIRGVVHYVLYILTNAYTHLLYICILTHGEEVKVLVFFVISVTWSTD